MAAGKVHRRNVFSPPVPFAQPLQLLSRHRANGRFISYARRSFTRSNEGTVVVVGFGRTGVDFLGPLEGADTALPFDSTDPWGDRRRAAIMSGSHGWIWFEIELIFDS